MEYFDMNGEVLQSCSRSLEVPGQTLPTTAAKLAGYVAMSLPLDSLSAFVAVAAAIYTFEKANPDPLSLRRISSAGQILLPMKPEKIVIHHS